MRIYTLGNILRLNKIVTTLIRYGFGGLVGELRILPFFSHIERVLIWRRAGRGLSGPVRTRLVLESLGPTFVKLGQSVSTREDLIPTEWLEELKKLQDAVPPFPFKEVREAVEGSLKKPLEEVYATFEEVPEASASIAQVHLATLHDGTPVAVKVKRPGIERTINADVAGMRLIAELFQTYVPSSRRYRPREMVHEFSRVIHKEQDLTIEGANINTFERIFKDDPTVQIPGMYWDYTTRDVLTLERISGTPIDEIETLRRKGHDTKKVARRALNSFFKQVFYHGVFHADQHPGNIFVRDDGVIIYLDFGIVGRLDRESKDFMAKMLYYTLKKDYLSMALMHRKLGLIDDDVDIHEFEDALRDITEPVFGKPLGEINISTLVTRLIRTSRLFHVKLHPNLLLLEKTMVVVDGVGRQLDPEINMWEISKPLITKWMIKDKFSPQAIADRSKEYTGDLSGALKALPINAHRALKKAAEDQLKVGFVHERLEPLADGITDAGKRITTGLIIASLIVGASVVSVFSAADAARVLGVPVLSAAGFAAALVLGLKLFFSSR